MDTIVTQRLYFSRALAFASSHKISLFHWNTRWTLIRIKYCRLLLRPLGLWALIYGYVSNLEIIISMILISVCLTSPLIVLLPVGYLSIFYVKHINLKIKYIGQGLILCFIDGWVLLPWHESTCYQALHRTDAKILYALSVLIFLYQRRGSFV